MKIFQVFVATAIASGALGNFPHAVFAQNGTATGSSLTLRLHALDQKLRILERRWEIEQETAAAKKKETPLLNAGQEGFSLKSADNRFQLKLRGYAQSDGRFFFADAEKRFTNTFLMRRIRPIFDGTLDKNFDFYFMLDFGGGTATVQDVYLDFRYWPQARVRVGKFKEPFGLERLQSGANLLFVERALPTNLVPNRDLGAQLHGELAKGAVTYALGVFNGVVDGGSADNDNGDEKDFVGRLFLLPFKNTSTALQGLGFGVAGSSGTQKGNVTAPSLPSYRTPAQQTYFSYRSDATAAGTAIASGKRARISPQGYYYSGPFGLLGEYVISKQEVTRGIISENLQNDSWQVAASYVITGQKTNCRGVTLPKPFEPKESNWGAFELAARYSKLNVDRDAFPAFADPAKSAQTATAWAVGINWYLNRNTKLTVDYEQTDFAGDRKLEKIVFSRLRLNY